jgi:hypothetical protein
VNLGAKNVSEGMPTPTEIMQRNSNETVMNHGRKCAGRPFAALLVSLKLLVKVHEVG